MPIADKIWYGWTPRESLNKGFRCVNGDSGQAQGKYQFDYRYGLIPFMKYCMELNPEHYSGFKPFINMGAGNRGLVYNKDLKALWLSYCDKYPEEFDAMQNACAYEQYYLPVKRKLKELYGINLDDHHPVVRGSAFSMSIRSGYVSAAKKFAGCSNNTKDATLLRKSYGTYGNKDDRRWTEAGQLGDALKALEKDKYDILMDNGLIIPKEKYVEPEEVMDEQPSEEESTTVLPENKNDQNKSEKSVEGEKVDDSNTKTEETTELVIEESLENLAEPEKKDNIVPEHEQAIQFFIGVDFDPESANKEYIFNDFEKAKEGSELLKTKEKKNIHVFNCDGGVIYEAKYIPTETVYAAPVLENDKLYIVAHATSNSGNGYDKEVGKFKILEDAVKCCKTYRNINKLTYHVFDPDGKSVYTEEYVNPNDKYYQVGTMWRQGECIGLKNTFKQCYPMYARANADSWTRSTGVVHYVFNPFGKVVYTGKNR